MTMIVVRAGLICSLLSGLLVAGSGCKGGQSLPPLAPVSGKVTVDGNALTSGHVVLVPQTGNPADNVPLSTAQIDSSGTYDIKTGGSRGAPLGKYKVIVTPMTVPGEAKDSTKAAPFHERFRDQQKTPLSFDVVSDPKPNAYDLKLTVK